MARLRKIGKKNNHPSMTQLMGEALHASLFFCDDTAPGGLGLGHPLQEKTHLTFLCRTRIMFLNFRRRPPVGCEGIAGS